jgi:hypothetical protein
MERWSEMGIDTHLFLPGDVQIRDVGDVAAILLGHEPELKPLTATSDHVDVKGIRIRGYEDIPGCAEINIEATEDMEYARSIFFTYEVEGRPGERLASLRANAEGIALFVKLAEFFGGTVDFNDCDDEEEDVKKSRPRGGNSTHEDGDFDRMQRRKMNVRAMSYSFVRSFEKHASY